MAAGVHSRAPAALRAFHHFLPMTSPYLVRVLTGAIAPTTVTPALTYLEAEKVVNQVLSGDFQGTVQLWRAMADGQAYELLIGYDRLLEPVVVPYTAVELANTYEYEAIQWDGDATSHPYQPEHF